MANYHPERKRLVSNAKSLRKEATEEEQKLWSRLRHSQLGVRFRRQSLIGVYVADFLCHSPKLVVELDGSQHVEQTDYDSRRTVWLRSQGFTVLRFWNFEINDDIEAVLETIRWHVDSQLSME